MTEKQYPSPTFPESDEEFAFFYAETVREAQRRADLKAIPERIREMAADYADLGGDPATLSTEPMPRPEPEPIFDITLDSRNPDDPVEEDEGPEPED